MTELIYAGIGSRETPAGILNLMNTIAKELASTGWMLRSGGAKEADQAFHIGASTANGEMEIYLPWDRFEGYRAGTYYANRIRLIVPKFDLNLEQSAAHFHPNWAACSDGAKKMHMRNVCQILGLDMKTPATMVVCWTKNGAGGGGTGQALRIAKHHNIPIFDLALSGSLTNLEAFVNSLAV